MANGLQDITGGAFQAFQQGQQLAGPNPLGIIAKQLTSRLQQMNQLKAEEASKIRIAQGTAQAEGEVQRGFFQDVIGGKFGKDLGGGIQGTVPTTTAPSTSAASLFEEFQAPKPGPTLESVTFGDTKIGLGGEAQRKADIQKAQRVELVQRAAIDVENQMRALIGQFNAFKKLEGEPGRGTGIRAGIESKLGEFTPGFLRAPKGEGELNPEIASMRGQIQESIIALGKIQVEGVRIPIALLERLEKTVLNLGSTEGEVATQVRSSLLNAFNRFMSAVGISVGSEQRKRMLTIIDDVLKTEALPSATLEGGVTGVGQEPLSVTSVVEN